MLTCPMCKKVLPPGTNPCSRCRADLTLLVEFMSHMDENLNKADEALKAGDLRQAVWGYLNVLETDPAHPVARKQVSEVVTAVRQFDEAKRTGLRTMFLFGASFVLAAVVLAGATFFVGYRVGVWKAALSPAAPPTTPATE